MFDENNNINNVRYTRDFSQKKFKSPFNMFETAGVEFVK